MTDTGFDLDLDDPQQAGVFFVTPADIAPLAAALRKAGQLTRRIDLHGCTGKLDVLSRIALALDVPDASQGRGMNWDSLLDVLRDLSWLPAPGHALLFDEAIHLRNADEDSFDTLLEILEQAAEDWADAGRPFWAFLALPDDEFEEAR